MTSELRPPKTKTERAIVCIFVMFWGVFIGSSGYQIYWNRQQNQLLYEFSDSAKTTLVPMDCKSIRGILGADYVVASARSLSGNKPAYVEACWYRLARLKEIYEIAEATDMSVIVRDQYRALNLRQRKFRPTPPTKWPLITIPIGVLIGIGGILQMFSRARKPEDREEPEVINPVFNPDQIALELSRLRKKLDGSKVL